MQFLEQSAALSSITITLQPYALAQPVDTSWHPGETVRAAVDRLLNSLRNFGDFLISFVISVLPWLLVLALIVYAAYRFVRRQMMRSRAKQGTSGADQS
jgi:ABC-type glycerol-3-phosphate transport system permease component